MGDGTRVWVIGSGDRHQTARSSAPAPQRPGTPATRERRRPFGRRAAARYGQRCRPPRGCPRPGRPAGRPRSGRPLASSCRPRSKGRDVPSPAAAYSPDRLGGRPGSDQPMVANSSNGALGRAGESVSEVRAGQRPGATSPPSSAQGDKPRDREQGRLRHAGARIGTSGTGALRPRAASRPPGEWQWRQRCSSQPATRPG